MSKILFVFKCFYVESCPERGREGARIHFYNNKMYQGEGVNFVFSLWESCGCNNAHVLVTLHCGPFLSFTP